MTGDQQLWQFCVGLTDSLRKEVEYLQSETIFEAMEYAQDNEYKIEGDKRTRMFGGHMAPLARHSIMNTEPVIVENRGGQGWKDSETSQRFIGQKPATQKKVLEEIN